MRTVQDILRELDTDRLIDTYLYDHPIQYGEWKDRTVSEIQDHCQEKLRAFIGKLRTIQIKPPEDGWISLFFVHRCIRDECDDVSFHLIYLDEFREKGYDCQSYSYEFMDQAEIMGFYVAETPLMTHYLYDLAAVIMEEASFFGFEQQYLQEECEELGRRLKEIKDGTAELLSWDEIKSEWDGLMDEESEDEKELHEKVRQAWIEYSEHSKRKELDAVRGLLITEGEYICTGGED